MLARLCRERARPSQGAGAACPSPPSFSPLVRHRPPLPFLPVDLFLPVLGVTARAEQTRMIFDMPVHLAHTDTRTHPFACTAHSTHDNVSRTDQPS